MTFKPRCNICKTLLDTVDPRSKDCGGDCLQCMAEIGEDPNCIKEMKKLEPHPDPCKYCGSRARVEIFRNASYGYYAETRGVCCQDRECGAHSPGYAMEDYDWKKRRHFAVAGDKKAIEWWNRRAKK